MYSLMNALLEAGSESAEADFESTNPIDYKKVEAIAASIPSKFLSFPLVIFPSLEYRLHRLNYIMGLEISKRPQKKRKARQTQGRVFPGTTLLIHGLSHEIGAEEVESRLSVFGEVSETHIIRQKRSNERVFVIGMVVMKRLEDAEAALNALKASSWSCFLVDYPQKFSTSLG
ncbi:hypothetical protein R1flu_026064 [Riccia fluitans]|uniref:RRM domain-containing protein n=1 Tax=Riccia fluitans TaxID=41844 RepID=A0ABD1XEX0_9MARC